MWPRLSRPHQIFQSRLLYQTPCLQQRRCKSFEVWEELGTIPAEQIAVINGRPYKTRQGHEKPLPLPPMLDAAYEAARSQHQLPKPNVELDKQTPFQRALARNPFAESLSSPIRHCTITGARLPRALLQPFDCYTDDGAATGRVQIMARPVSRVTKKYPTSMGKQSYVALDKATLAGLSRKLTRSLLLIRAMQTTLEARLGHGVGRRHKLSITLDYDTAISVPAMLTTEVQDVVDKSIRDKHYVTVNDSRRRRPQEVVMFITFGAPCYIDLLPGGLLHYAWDGMPSSQELRDRMTADGCNTIGLVAGQQSIKVAMALDRLFQYQEVFEHKDSQVQLVMQAAVERWRAGPSSAQRSPADTPFKTLLQRVQRWLGSR